VMYWLSLLTAIASYKCLALGAASSPLRGHHYHLYQSFLLFALLVPTSPGCLHWTCLSYALAYRSPGHKTASLVGDSTNSGTAVTAAAYTCHQGLENRPTNLLSPEREFLVFSVFRPFHPLGVVRTFMGETASTTQTLIIVSLHLDNGEQRNVFCVHGSSTCLAVWLWRLPGPI
jgi:hypothetical protein